MILKLTKKNCRISDEAYEHIEKHLGKIGLYLRGIESDLVVFRLLIRRNIDRYHPPKTYPHHQSYADDKPALAYFEGAITFRLSKKQLYVHFKGHTVDECIDTGFDLIFREIEKYKDEHFPSESEYPDRSSLRAR